MQNNNNTVTAPSRPFGSGAEPTKTNSNQPVTVVVTRLVREGHEPGYEEALVRLTGQCQDMPGYLGATVRRPLPDANPREYSTIYRFASAGHLHQFDRSQAHRDFVAEVAPHVLADADWHDETGREFWFHPASAETREPVRWRMAAVTVVVVYVLVLLLGHLADAVLGHQPLWMRLLAAVVVQTILMSYWLMPRLTQWLSRWIYSGRRKTT